MSSPSIGFCPFCGAAVAPPGRFCAGCGQQLPASPGAAPQPQPPSAPVPQGGPRCPSCGSMQVQAGKRGWKWTTGMIGSGKIVFTCLQCGKKFNAA